ncbi:MAG: O-antigen ligase family protein [Terriglobales bacterium]
MATIIVLDLIVILILVGIVLSKGFEDALPYVTFVCILLPGTCRINVGLFDLTAQRLVLMVLIVLYAFTAKKNGPQKLPLQWLILAQVIWALISTANSVDPVMSLKKLLSVAVEYYLLYLIFLRSISSIRTVYRILGAMVGAMVVCSVFGTIELYGHWSVMSLFPAKVSRIGLLLGLTGGNEGRITATFPHPILFGAALAIALTVAMHLVKIANTSRRRVLLWMAILLMFLNIYRTLSRGPWLGLILAFLLFFFLEGGKLRKYQVAIAALCVLVMIIRPGVFETIKNLYYETTTTADWNDSPRTLGIAYRYELRRVAQQELEKSPARALWGYGMESFSYLNLQGHLAGHDFPFLSCDSAWIEIMIETGYGGLLLLGALLIKPAVLAWKNYRSFPEADKYLSLTFFISFVIYYFMMLSVAMYAWGQEGYMLWIMVACSIAYGNLVVSKSRASASSDAPIRIHEPAAMPAALSS